jgi:hypothetical protein
MPFGELLIPRDISDEISLIRRRKKNPPLESFRMIPLAPTSVSGGSVRRPPEGTSTVIQKVLAVEF